MHIEGNLNNREVIMKLSDFKKFIPTDRYLDEVEIIPMEFMEQITFGKGLHVDAEAYHMIIAKKHWRG